MISVGLDHFEQERPRTSSQIQLLADHYHLCNPHTEFHWTVEIDGAEWIEEYAADSGWTDKFHGTAPVQWYSARAFSDLLGALYRKHFGHSEDGQLSLDVVQQCFNDYECETTTEGPNQLNLENGADFSPKSSLTKADIEGQAATQLYGALCKNSPRFDSTNLGHIGREQIYQMLTHTLPVEGNLIYETTTDNGDDHSVPFVIEAAVARLQEGKRQIWTAVNFTPTYGDPFLRRWLYAPIQPDESVLGLRGLLEAYGMLEDTPVAVFLHLICPNIEHDEFSKTDINHLPFKQTLGDLLDRLLTSLKQMEENEKLQLEQAVFRALDIILERLGAEERFVFDQLLEKLRAQLSQDPTLSTWLNSPDALSRLRAYITDYQSHNAILTTHVARSAAGTVSIPLHPDRHFSVMVEHISHDLLQKNHVNKLLYIQVRELEPVVIENSWLCMMDMALLRAPSHPSGLEDTLVQCVLKSNLPLLMLHNADDAGQDAVKQVCAWLEEHSMDTTRLIDVGLTTEPDGGIQAKLVEMMPGELAAWLIARLETLGIPIKFLPSDAEIRQDIRSRFEQLLLGYLWEGLSQKLEVAQLIDNLDRQLHFTKAMISQELDKHLKHCLQQIFCAKSYTAILEEATDGFFESFRRKHSARIQELTQEHLTHMRGLNNE